MLCAHLLSPQDLNSPEKVKFPDVGQYERSYAVAASSLDSELARIGFQFGRDSDSRLSAPELSQAVKPAITITGMTYNVFGLPKLFGQGGANFQRLAAIGDSLANSKMSFVCLQECWHDSSKVLVERSGFPFVAQGGRRLTGLFGNRGLIIISRYPIIAQDEIRFSNQMGYEAVTGKGVQWARLMLPSGERVDVYNTHLVSGHSGIAADALVDLKKATNIRIAQLGELFAFVARNSSPNIPVILCGDFNFSVGTDEERLARSILGFDLQRQIVGANQEVTPESVRPEATLSGANPLIRNKRQQPVCVDYVFVVGGTIDLAQSSEKLAFVDNPLSDHYAKQFSLVLSQLQGDPALSDMEAQSTPSSTGKRAVKAFMLALAAVAIKKTRWLKGTRLPRNA